MARQTYLFGDPTDSTEGVRPRRAGLKLCTWNVQSPSFDRSAVQLEWLRQVNADILVLTELKATDGSRHLVSSIEARGYHVVFDEPPQGAYGVLVAARRDISSLQRNTLDRREVLGCRVKEIRVNALPNSLTIIGVYAPSRSPGEAVQARERRRAFQSTLLEALRVRVPQEDTIVLGDFNVVARQDRVAAGIFDHADFDFYEGLGRVGLTDCYLRHSPSGRDFSWEGAWGGKQRIDHSFATAGVLRRISTVWYDHEPRQTKLSDHAALLLTVSATTG